MKKILIVLLTFFTGVTQAQDMFSEYLYSADRVMKNRETISLTDAQAEKIKKIHSANAADFTTLKWDLDAATAKLKTLLAAPKPNQEAVQKQMDLVLSLENSLKKKQLSTLVAIKNELTESQQNTLKTTKTYTVAGISPTLQANGTKYAIGRPTASTVTGSGSNPKVSVQIAGTASSGSPVFYLKNSDGLKKINEASMKDINPDDIEKIEVLKDKSATDKFGEDGANGVIIIYLKKGKENNFEKK
ncbi:MAG: periplasmic heavy metal sensor [Algoriphagus sp.]|nr:periplasmic heavy metal sensor [Algoriphagus sp.]